MVLFSEPMGLRKPARGRHSGKGTSQVGASGRPVVIRSNESEYDIVLQQSFRAMRETAICCCRHHAPHWIWKEHRPDLVREGRPFPP